MLQRTPARFVQLGFLQLESREMPALTVDLVGLRFEATRDFSDLGNGVYTVTGPVSVGVEPAVGVTFKPVMTFTDGFRIRSYTGKDADGNPTPDAELDLTSSTIQVSGGDQQKLFEGNFHFESVNKLKEKGVTELLGGSIIPVTNWLQVVPTGLKFDGSTVQLGGHAAVYDNSGRDTAIVPYIPVNVWQNGEQDVSGGLSVRYDESGKAAIAGSFDLKNISMWGLRAVGAAGITVQVAADGSVAKASVYGSLEHETGSKFWKLRWHLGTKAAPGFTIDNKGLSVALGVSGKFNAENVLIEVPATDPVMIRASALWGGFDWNKIEWGASGKVKFSSFAQSQKSDDTTGRVAREFDLHELMQDGSDFLVVSDVPLPPPKTPSDPAPPKADEKPSFNGLEADFAFALKGGKFKSVSLYATTGGKFKMWMLDGQIKGGLGFTYNADADLWAIGGAVTFTHKNYLKGEVVLPKDGLTIRNGKLSFNGLRVALSVLDEVPDVGFRSIEVEYAKLPGGVLKFALGGVVRLPAGFDVGLRGEFRFGGDVGFALDRVRIDYEKGNTLGLPLGSSGLYITHLGLEVQNIFTSAVRFVGAVKAETPGQVNLAGTRAGLMELTGDFIFDWPTKVFALEGRFRMVGGKLGEGSARVMLDIPRGVYRLDADVTFLDGMVRLQLRSDLNSELLRIAAKADVSVPKSVPYVGGTRLAGVDVVLLIHRNNADDRYTSYFAFWVVPYFKSWTFGAQYRWGKETGWVYVGEDDAKRISEDFKREPTTYSYETKVKVEAGRPTVGVEGELAWDYEVPGAKLEVKDSAGNIVNATILASTDRSLRFRIGAASGINPLATGEYTIRITGSRVFGARNDANDFRKKTISLINGDKPTVSIGALTVDGTGAAKLLFGTTGVRGTTVRVRMFAVTADYPHGTEVAMTDVSAGTSGELVWGSFGSAVPIGHQFFVTIEDVLTTYPATKSLTTSGSVRPPVQAGGTVRRQAGGARSTTLANWPLYIDLDGNGGYSDGEPTYHTDANGGFLFNGLAPGTYTLRVATPSGYRAAAGQSLVDGKPGYRVTIGPGQPLRQDWNFSLVQSNTVEGFAFNDVNGNGRRDAGEGPAVGVTTYLDRNGNGLYEFGEPTAVTGNDGGYSFIDVEPGTYSVRVIAPTAGRVTTASGGTATVVGTDNLAVGPQFGLVLPVKISGRAFVERGGELGYTHGIDTPLPGAVLTLVDGLGQPVRDASGRVISVTAGAEGLYQFDPLPAGDYRVVQTPPAGYTPVSGSVESGGFTPAKPAGDLGIANQGRSTTTLADVNFDGIPDLLVASPNMIPTRRPEGYWPVVVMLGKGDGTFGPAVEANRTQITDSSAPNNRPVPELVYGQWMTVADMNRDKRPDVVLVTSYRSGGRDWLDVQILFSNTYPRTAGGGITTTESSGFLQTLPLSGTAVAPAAGVSDFNGDGWLDLVLAADSRPTVLLNRFEKDPQQRLGQYSFEFTPVPVAQPAGPWGQVDGLALGQFSANGQTGVVLSTRTGDRQEVVRLWNDGKGQLSPDPAQPLGGASGPMASGDFNRDGLTDVAVLDRTNSAVRVGLNMAHGQFRSADAKEPFGSLPLPGVTLLSIAVADMNADGWADIVVSGVSGGKPKTFVLLNDANGTFLPAIELTTGSPPSGDGGVTVGDLNGDGRPDLVYSDTGRAWVTLNGSPAGTSRPLNLVSGDAVVVDTAYRGNASISGSVPADSKFGYINKYGVLITQNVRQGDLVAYIDENHNNRYDVGERTTTFTTSADGIRWEFRFDSLDAGTYSIGIWHRGDYDYFTNGLRIPTATAFTMLSLSATLAEGQAVSDLRFERPGGRVRGTVFIDRNKNNRQDADEPGLAGVIVFDDTNRNGQFDAGEVVLATTDAAGKYDLTVAASTFWRLGVIAPSGYSLSTNLFGAAAQYLVNGQPVTQYASPRPIYLDGGVSVEEVLLPLIPVKTSGLATTPKQTSAPTHAVRLAAADITQDGRPDLVVAAGAGEAPRVRVFDAVTGDIIRDFNAYDPAFLGGVNVAVGDVTGDGVADIITGAGAGGGPHVKVFDGKTGAEVRSFYAYDPAFQGGVNVAVGDVTGDGVADVITGAGTGGGPHVKVFDGKTGKVAREIMTFDTGFRGGVFLAATDLDGDGVADVITGAGAGGGPHVKVFDGRTGAEVRSFYAHNADFTGGVFVHTGDLDVDGRHEMLLGAGPWSDPWIRVFDGLGLEVDYDLKLPTVV